MPGLSRQFRRRVAEDLEMWTNQPFTTPLMLGDIGSISGGRFETSTATSLQDLGIAFGAPIEGPSSPIRWQSNRDGSFALTFKAKGDPPIGGLAEADIGVSISFGRKGNYVFQANDAKISRIQETSELHEALAQARAQGRLSMQDRIVMSCLTAQRAKIYVSETSEAELALSASAEFASLVDAGVELKVKRQRGSILEIDVDAQQPVVFFMKLVRVRRWGDIHSVRSLKMAASDPVSRADFVRSEVPDVYQLEVSSPFEEDDFED
jgi:hypothetical protein